MSEQEIFGECLNLIVSTFKKDAEKGIIHMKNLMQLSDSPFNRANKDDKGVSTSKGFEDEARSSRRF